MSNTMRAIRSEGFHGLDGFRLDALPIPVPGPTQVLVRVAAAGVNPVDWKIAEGFGEALGVALPYTPGCEIAGIVEAMGEEAKSFAPGERVYGYISLRRCGGFAEYALAEVEELARIPEPLSYIEAAAVPVGALTSWQALFDSAKVEAGQRVLVHAAAGGVGSLAVQLAKAQGAYVIGTASARNAEFVRGLGADECIDYTEQPFEEAVQAVDVVFDTIGGETQERSFQIINEGGYLVSIVSPPPTHLGAEYQVDVSMTAVQPSGTQLEAIGAMIRGGKLRVEVAQTYPLDRAAEALARSKEGHTRGKLVLTL